MTDEKVELVKGTVETISSKQGTKGPQYGIKINGEWFNGFGMPGCKKGDEISLSFVLNGQWKNVKAVKVESESVEIPEEDSTNPEDKKKYWNDRNNQIARMSCLARAIEFYELNAKINEDLEIAITVPEVIELSNQLFEYVETGKLLSDEESVEDSEK